MAGNRDIKYPVGQPGFSNMMSGSRQFVQPGMTFHPLIQQPLPRIAGGIPQSPQQMFPLQGQSFQMAPRRMAPPSYNQHISQNFVRNRPAMVVPTRPPPSQKDIQFQIQQQRLKQFGQTKHVKADADKFIESMFGKTEKPKGRMDRHLVTVSTAQPPASSSHSTASSSHVSISQQSTPTIQPSMSHTSSDNPGQVNAKRIGQGPAVRKDPHEPRLLSYPETKVTIICHNSLPSSAQSVPEDDGFGDFLQGPMTSSTSKPPDASPASASVVTDNTHPNPASVQPDTSTVTTSKPPEQKKDFLPRTTHINYQDESGSETSEKTVILPADSPSLQTTTTVSPPKIPRLDIDPEYDLMSMMMACSDLNAPKTAKLFHKPAVKDVQVSHHTNKTYHQSDQARQWQSSTELEGLFHQNIPEAQPGPVPPAEAAGNTSSVVASASTTASPAAGTPSGKPLPEWCYRSGKDLPPLYQQVYEAALVDGKIDTNRLYPILLLSCLPREVLGYIWSMCNTATPGQLIQTELNAVLALIALAQNNHSIMNKEILKRCPQPPLPILQSVPPVAPGGVAPSVSPGPQPTPGTPQPNQLPENQNHPSVAPTNQAPATSSFSVVAPKPTLGTGIVQQNPGTIQPISAPTASLTPHSIGGTMGGSRNINQSEPAIITHTSEDDFADFQSADKATTEDEFGEFMGTNNPACITVEEKPPYIISVPKVDPKVSDEMTADEKYSNVRSFFGSSGSSAPNTVSQSLYQGHTSPNSLDEEDYTDCRDSTSQFSTSEQSENEDIKAFESYVEEFNRKKEKLHPESPLHNPFPRLPVIDKATSNIVIPPIPSSFGLQLSSEATPQDDFDDFKSAIQVSTPSAVTTVTSSDSEFADFQTSSKPVPSSSSTSNDLNLIGDEDKYGALRSLVLEDPATTTKPSEATVPFAQFDEAVTENESDDWADFASAAPEESANNGNNKSSVLNVNSTKQPETDWADFGDTVTPTAETVNIQPSWISSNPTLLTPTNIMSRSSNSVSSTSLAGTETEDDWSDFSTAINQDSQATPSNPLEESDWFNSTGTSDTTTSVVTVKKALKSDEIQNVFKVRNDPNTQASYKIPTLEKKVRQISLDDDDPPPMDYHDEGDDHDITRGYDLEEYHNPSPLSGYGYSNQNKGMFLNQVGKKISEKSDRDRTSLSPETEDDSYSSKDSYNWKGKTKHFKEDSQSISSLELPTKTASLKTGSDNGGSDSQSISSMEFGQFESSSKTPVSAESKSLDSLDFPQDLPGDGDPDETLENTDTVDLDSSMNQSTPGISNGIKPLADRYNITDEVVTSDGYSYEWERCLQNCLRMIKESNIIFNSISTSNVCTEVLQSSKGSAYIDGIVEIYRVACRVMTAMNAHNLATPQLEKLMKEIDLAWTNLTAFLVGAGVLPESKSFDFKHGIMKSDSEEDQYKSCGVCLLNVDTRLKVISGVEDISKLSYGRKQYHAPCANFWVNCVDSTLPGLRLPELL